ncbi:dihydropteroate synthase [bacterium]|nr:dihydropteroate synthase [bacterium]
MVMRVIEKNTLKSIKAEMEKIGVNAKGIELMLKKGIFKLIKIDKINNKAANLLKQEMLVKGGEAAINYKVADFKEGYTDVLLMGTLEQYSQLVNHLIEQPFGLKEVAKQIDVVLNNSSERNFKIKCGGYLLDFNKKTYIMGVLNITPDSFSDGGKYYTNCDKAIFCAQQMAEEGVDIIDIGGESSRPGAIPISEEEEKKRILPIIKKLTKKIKIPISIDTYKPGVARAAIMEGASLINDISGLQDEEMIKVINEFNVPVIIMHMQGSPQCMQENPQYKEVISDIISFFQERIQRAENNGISKENLILDPGIGFGKTTKHNLEILRRLEEFKILGCPLLIGTSRKRFIGDILELPVGQRLEGSLATCLWSIFKGINILRVHDVLSTVRAVRMVDAILYG